ncbi:MAG: hypothetical protein GF381_02915 [Candidatus Pacebacteria bacterium]|nr:hypothetical protein [Candidatus Paceibacterota bacterium]
MKLGRKSKLALFALIWLAAAGILVHSGRLTLKPTSVSAQNCEEAYDCDREDYGEDQRKQCLEDKIDCLEGKVSEKQEQAQTLKGAINLINGEISLQQVQISQTLWEIDQLEKDISQLEERIGGLSLSLDRLTGMLIERIQAVYKQQRTNPLLILLVSDNFSNFVSQYRYLSEAEKQTAAAMQQAENQRVLYDQQKNLKEVKQEEVQAKQDRLQVQKTELEQKKSSKQQLLTETKNDEATYQRLLYEAQKEIASLKSYATSQAEGTCLSSAQPQPDGWYWNQRDSRWCSQYIGNSSETIGAVGCLITSTAMIWTKHGHNTTPSTIAANPSYFRWNTAYMAYIPAPPGYKYQRYNYRDLDLIDSELSAGRPVIVHLNIGTYDGHFIVLKSGNNGNYIMNDPLFQADMPFDSKYSTSQIDSIRTFRPE